MSRSLVAGSVLVQSISTGIPAYHRHQPEQTTLYSIIAADYPRFVQKIGHGGGHLHMLFLDGAYTCSGNRPTFHRARRHELDAIRDNGHSVMEDGQVRISGTVDRFWFDTDVNFWTVEFIMASHP